MDTLCTDNMVLDMGLALDIEPASGTGTLHIPLLPILMSPVLVHLIILQQKEHHSLPHDDVLRGYALHGCGLLNDALHGDGLHDDLRDDDLHDGDDSLDQHSQNLIDYCSFSFISHSCNLLTLYLQYVRNLSQEWAKKIQKSERC